MTATEAPFAELLNALDARIAGALSATGAMALADQQLAEAETILEAWLDAKGRVPGEAEVEGFRLLGLHRQAAKGDPSFNACRETCREVVYFRNLIASYDGDKPEALHDLRLQAMVVKHLALFIGGKLQEAGLGEFCCSSRPVRQSEATAVGATTQGD
jgi:hypothetical protein